MKARKAVITAAGWGTRFLPVTKAQPKEMLPLLNKPIIQYAVEEAIASGIEQIIIVTTMGKHSVENHFDHSFELEYVLQQKGMPEALAEISSIGNSSQIYYVRQREQLGLLKASIAFALESTDMGEELREYLSELRLVGSSARDVIDSKDGGISLRT